MIVRTSNTLAFANGLSALDGSDIAEQSGEGCIANIGPKERRQRLRFGIVSAGAGAVLALALIGLHADPLWRLAVFFPLAAGASGYFQARDKT